MISAVIFDLDGLLVDSTPLQLKASHKFLENYGKLHFTSHAGREGMRMIDIIEEYKDIYDLPGSVEDLYHQRQQIFFEMAHNELQLFPGALPLLAELNLRGLKLALATSGDRDYLQLIFAKFPELKNYFIVVISSEDVLQGKPSPEVFTKTAQKLGLPANECVVLEDSANGILAAKAAGMQVICVPNQNYPDADYSGADKIFSTLKEVASILQ
ncbi:TPA: HAD family phosphatase [Patescibacteria group bacterium]|uniref:HAD-superfamily hydrolase, subfamily IA, variant 3 n=1 Tax=Candidatus Gottesmanbacteria bacterium GW2011_GWA1_43_11 TaxID=1618436 RepID=A0A0G1CD22_9BACT|nr:MAG: HAD-superfamily hydrolase, subfamily IA, variant 3 [Candidatus Gottesmanbacteria bacterium GW2011_GWA1_43_11]HCS79163.1 HAD family phosphatase [Patescibacteria group bacterium]